mmetsp:Transcript_2947/g.8622  ORF Transcript_2947/g.8622 Transcript_2947/m.8622 type:complete len:256 (-) Transcript_2947:1456-2223(-)
MSAHCRRSQAVRGSTPSRATTLSQMRCSDATPSATSLGKAGPDCWPGSGFQQGRGLSRHSASSDSPSPSGCCRLKGCTASGSQHHDCSAMECFSPTATKLARLRPSTRAGTMLSYSLAARCLFRCRLWMLEAPSGDAPSMHVCDGVLAMAMAMPPPPHMPTPPRSAPTRSPPLRSPPPRSPPGSVAAPWRPAAAYAASRGFDQPSNMYTSPSAVTAAVRYLPAAMLTTMRPARAPPTSCTCSTGSADRHASSTPS